MFVTLTQDIAHFMIQADEHEDALHTLFWDLLCIEDFNLRAEEVRRLRSQCATRSFSEAVRVVQEAGCPVEIRHLDPRTRISRAKTNERLADVMRAFLEPIADVWVARADLDLDKSSSGWGQNMGIFGNSTQTDTVFLPEGVSDDLEGCVSIDHDIFTVRMRDTCTAALALVTQTPKVTVAAASIVACVIMELFGLVSRTGGSNPDAARVERVRKAALRLKKRAA
jgi:hypothetical protein